MRGHKNLLAWFSEAARVVEDPTAPEWLKRALSDALNRDPLEAEKAACTLYEILHSRAVANAPKARGPKAGNGAATPKVSPITVANVPESRSSTKAPQELTKTNNNPD